MSWGGGLVTWIHCENGVRYQSGVTVACASSVWLCEMEESGVAVVLAAFEWWCEMEESGVAVVMQVESVGSGVESGVAVVLAAFERWCKLEDHAGLEYGGVAAVLAAFERWCELEDHGLDYGGVTVVLAEVVQVRLCLSVVRVQSGRRKGVWIDRGSIEW